MITPDGRLTKRMRSALGSLDDVWVVLVDAEESERELHLVLSAVGPFDAVIDFVAARSFRRFEQLFFHLDRGGVYVLPQHAGTVRKLEKLFAEQEDVALQPARRVSRQAALQLHAEWIARADGTHMFLRCNISALAVVRDHEMTNLLQENPENGTVLTSIPGQRWHVESETRTSRPLDANPMPRDYVVPDMFLRAYTDVVVMPRQVAISGHLVLPESFTTVETRRQRNVSLRNLGTDFVMKPDPLEDVPVLKGTYFHLDNLMSHHFGHLMSEQVSHMWGWAHAKAEHPELRALVFTESGRLERWQTELLTAGGPTEDEITVLRQPHRVERLVGTTPMFSRPAFVHPELRTVYDRIGTELSANSGLTDTPRRIFLSRRGSKRECVNSAEVERLVDEFGFLIICPEDFSLSDQARMVRAADVIAGYAGSQMFSIALAGGSKRVVLFCSESYPAHNEYMLSALLGHQLSVVVCDAQVKRRSGQFSREAFHSNFRFDLARDGAFARRSLS